MMQLNCLWRYCVRHMVEKEMKKDQYYRSRDELIEMRWIGKEELTLSCFVK